MFAKTGFAACLFFLFVSLSGCSEEKPSPPRPQRVSEDLTSGDRFLVREALEEVRKKNLREYLPLIRQLALTASPLERYESLGVMRKLQDRGGVDVFLEAALEDENQNMRIRAYRALAELGDFTVFTGVLLGLESKDRATRLGAVHVLGNLGLIEGIPYLIALWESDDDYSTAVGIRRALENTTGLKLGKSSAAWRDWWGDYGVLRRKR